MSLTLGMLFAGLLLSAFFSGSETGFYRAGRIRLAMDARQGGLVAKALLWLTNNPSWFVATALVGNNLANYLTSLAVILLTVQLVGESQFVVELVAPIVAAPFVFVYGELLPKNMFFMAPNRLIRRTGPVFLMFAVLFFPISVVLWLLGAILQLVFGESHVRVRQRLARGELRRLLEEGHDAGILEDVQRQLAQSVFDVANDKVQRLCTPLARLVTVRDSYSADQVIRTARRFRVPEIVVCRGATRTVLGYVRLADIALHQQDWRDATRPLTALRYDQSHLSALVRLQSRSETMGEVVDSQGKTIGILSINQLLRPLFQEQ